MVERKLTRIEKGQRLLKEHNLNALLIKDPISLFYFTELNLSTGILYITENEAHLIVDARYFEGIKDKSPCKIFCGSPLEETLLKESISHSKEALKIGFLAEKMSVSELTTLKLKLKNRAKIRFLVADDLLHSLRAVKDPHEIMLMKKAALLTKEGIDFILQEKLKEGITEEMLAKELLIFWLEKGAQGVAFESIIAFGKNSAMPHYRAGQSKLKKGDLVQIDAGVLLNHYCSDMSRITFFGPPKKELSKIFKVVEEAQEAALSLCKEGIEVKKLDEAARRVIENAGYGKYFVHSLGHGVGLEVHETPYLRKSSPKNSVLKEGMVVTVEPGIYLPGIGGIRIEDTILIKKNNCEILTR